MLRQEKIFNLWRKVFLLTFEAFKFNQEFSLFGRTIKPSAVGPNICRDMLKTAFSWRRHFSYGTKAKISARMGQIRKP